MEVYQSSEGQRHPGSFSHALYMYMYRMKNNDGLRPMNRVIHRELAPIIPTGVSVHVHTCN